MVKYLLISVFLLTACASQPLPAPQQIAVIEKTLNLKNVKNLEDVKKILKVFVPTIAYKKGDVEMEKKASEVKGLYE